MFLVERTGVLLRFRVGLHAATEPWGWGNRRTIPRARFTGGHAQVCPWLSTFLLQGGYLRFSLQILINILSEISVTFFVDSPFVLVPRAVLDVRGVLLACTSKQQRCSCVADPHHPKQATSEGWADSRATLRHPACRRSRVSAPRRARFRPGQSLLGCRAQRQVSLARKVRPGRRRPGRKLRETQPTRVHFGR